MAIPQERRRSFSPRFLFVYTWNRTIISPNVQRLNHLSMQELTYDFFRVSDGNAMTLEERIAESLNSLQNENDYIIFEDGRICHNEQELRNVLKEEGGIL